MPPRSLINTLTITDVDDTNIESATITISGGLVSAEDVLSFTDANGITGSYDANTGILTLTGTATLADYELALEAVKYQNTNGDDPNTGSRTVTWVVNDGDTNSAGITSTITVAAVNDAPTATNLNQTQSYTEGTLNVALTNIIVSDADKGNTVTATLALGNTAIGTLTASSGNGESFNSGTGVWRVTGSTTVVNAALAGVSFVPTTDNDVDTTITTHIEDAAATGLADGIITLDVTPVNDNPVANADTATTNQGVVLNNINVLGNDTDIGSNTLAVTGATATQGIVTINSDGTLNYTPNAGFSGMDTISYQIDDGDGGTDTATLTVGVVSNGSQFGIFAPADPIDPTDPITLQDSQEQDEDISTETEAPVKSGEAESNVEPESVVSGDSLEEGTPNFPTN